MAELRRYRRYDGYDYSRGAALFITITTKPRRQVFGKVTDAKMELSPLGKEAAASIVRIFNTHELTLYRKVVMPDHVHFSIHLKPGMDNDAARRLLNRATGKFKSRIDELVKRLESESGAITIMSGFISPGERQVLDMLLKRKDAQIIKVMPYALPHDYAPPVAWMEAIKEGRMAIIARGNSPEEMSRQACLDMNAVIAGMADKAVVCGPHRGHTQDQLGGGGGSD